MKVKKRGVVKMKVKKELFKSNAKQRNSPSTNDCPTAGGVCGAALPCPPAVVVCGRWQRQRQRSSWRERLADVAPPPLHAAGMLHRSPCVWASDDRSVRTARSQPPPLPPRPVPRGLRHVHLCTASGCDCAAALRPCLTGSQIPAPSRCLSFTESA